MHRTPSAAIRTSIAWRCQAAGVAIFATAALAATALSAAPAITNVSLRGLQAGGTTRLVIDGAELGATPQIVLPVPIAKQEIEAGGTPQRVTIAVTLDAAVASGIYPLRIATANGVSPAVAVGIDPLPQLPYAPEASQLPVALHGNLTGATILRTTIAGKKGERLAVDVEARRLGAKLNPLLHVYDPRGVQLGWSQGIASASGDARLEVVLPADGAYVVELHDALYRGEGPGHFRLKIGELYFADLAFPLAARRGTEAAIGGAASNLPAEPIGRAKFDGLSASAPLPWPAVGPISGSRPTVIVSDVAEFVEATAAGPQEVPAVPVGINGRLAAEKEEDVYRLPVTAGAALRFDLLANRAGSKLDGVLSIRNEQGGQLAQSDDRPGTVDPGLDFTVPAGVEHLLVAVRDLQHRGGPDFIYRLSVVSTTQPAFDCNAAASSLVVPRDGITLLRVEAKRAGFNGPIKLKFAGLPAGVTIAGDEIPAGAGQTLIAFSAAGAAPSTALAALTAESADPQMPLIGSVVLGTEETWAQAWLRNQFAVSVVEPAALQVAWQGIAADTKLTPGGKLPIKVTVERGETLKGPVRLSLVTSQAVPKKTVKQNNVDVMVDDEEKALRLEGQPMLAAEAREIDVQLLAPADLPKLPYDVALQAELLGPDGKTVLATRVTAPFRLATP